MATELAVKVVRFWRKRFQGPCRMLRAGRNQKPTRKLLVILLQRVASISLLLELGVSSE